MSDNRRVNIQRILTDKDLRRRLMVSTIQATQAREGIETTTEQAARAYDIVTERDRVAFFALFLFANSSGDARERAFAEALREPSSEIRADVPYRDFRIIEGHPLAYRQVSLLGPLFRRFPSLSPNYGRTRSGLNTTEIERFVRQRWEVTSQRRWKPFAKGGDFSRFYTDWDLVFDWGDSGHEFKSVVASKYGSASRFVKSEDDYFKSGITWMQTTNLGINARMLPDDGIFGVASPSLFLNDQSFNEYLLGVMNTDIFNALAHTVATRNWGATAIGSLPVPMPTHAQRVAIEAAARIIADEKRAWDRGNELSSLFVVPWLIGDERGIRDTLPAALQRLRNLESIIDGRLQSTFQDLNAKVNQLYGFSTSQVGELEKIGGKRPIETVWPQMTGKAADQKRMEHVWRLLSYTVKRVVETEADGVVPFLHISGEAPLLDRVHVELGKLFPGRDVNEVEVEIVNELKRKVKGYDRVESIREWLENVYFAYHTSMYKKRPIFWHISSKQGKAPAAFSVLVHYHRFDKDRMAKLRGVYLREAIGVFRREAALAGQAGRTDDRLEWQAKVEETEELDRRLQRIMEGFHQGGEDFRILTPWKAEGERPEGWDPDINDGVKVNIEPLQRAGVLRISEVV
jgi:hypothetical protein